MIRAVSVALVLGLVATSLPALAQTKEGTHHSRKAPRKAAAPAPRAIDGINAPSTDFSKIERADEDAKGPGGPAFRPTMGSGGMGMGAAF